MNSKALYSLPLALVLLLNQYELLGLPVGIVPILGAAIILFTKIPSIKIERSFLNFIGSVFVFLLLNLGHYSELSNGTINYYIGGILYVIAILVYSKKIKIENFYNVYQPLGIIASAAVLAQGAYMVFFQVDVAPIRLMPVSVEKLHAWLPYHRPSGFFSEPQLFCSFILPLFLISVLQRNKALCAFLGLAIIISGSIYGIFIGSALLARSLINSRDFKRSVGTIGALAFCVVIFTVPFGLLDAALDKFEKTEILNGIRVGKAIFLFFQMELIELGLGLGVSVADFTRSNIEYLPWLTRYVENDSHLLGYVSGYFGLALFYGVFPVLTFSYHLLFVYRNGSDFQKGMVIIIFLHSISSTIMFNGYFIFFYGLIFMGSTTFSNSLRFWNIKYG